MARKRVEAPVIEPEPVTPEPEPAVQAAPADPVDERPEIRAARFDGAAPISPLSGPALGPFRPPVRA